MKYVIGVLSVVLLLIFAVILIVSRGGGDGDVKGPQAVKLSDYIQPGSSVEYSIEGPIVAEEERRAVRIYVSNSERVLEVLHGYGEQAARREVLSNNEQAYSEFMLALERAGFAVERSGVEGDEGGRCAVGSRYIYKLRDGSSEVFRHWSTGCRRNEGSFKGDAGLVRRLFERQIPRYSEIVNGVDIN